MQSGMKKNLPQQQAFGYFCSKYAVLKYCFWLVLNFYIVKTD